MKIYIYRGGSGCGGIYGRCLIDTSERKIVNLCKYSEWNHCNSHQRHPGKDCVDSLSSEVSDYPAECVKDFSYDLSLLESFLDTCELHANQFAAMDQQADTVYILTSSSEVRKVWDTSYGEIYPENPALCAKLQKLIDFTPSE